jgi:hypothetical protein
MDNIIVPLFTFYQKRMNTPKNVFTIRDLENLSGIKAHTIRIWEKRYNVLEPMRTDSNIRVYNMHSLQKLLNICALHAYGYKISAIAKLSEEKIPIMVREILNNKTLNNHVLNNFKLAMMNFDQQLFFNTYNNLLHERSFRDIFYGCFLPLMEEIGMLWQTDTITPAHEHFISSLIKQKIFANIEKLHNTPPVKKDRVFVLYLPEGEIHDIGLMFINYELILNGHKTVFIGKSIAVADLKDLKNYFDHVTYITYLTVEPSAAEVNNYIEIMSREVVNDDNTRLEIFGRTASYIQPALLSDSIAVHNNIKDYCEAI